MRISSLNAWLLLSCVLPTQASTLWQPCTLEHLQGSWQLESAEYRDKAGQLLAKVETGQLQSRKIVAGNYFSFVTWQPDGQFQVAATGRFSLKQSQYVEWVDASSLKQLRAKSYAFDCALQDNLWHHSGDEDGTQINEYWRKLPPSA